MKRLTHSLFTRIKHLPRFLFSENIHLVSWKVNGDSKDVDATIFDDIKPFDGMADAFSAVSKSAEPKSLANARGFAEFHYPKR